MTPTTKAGKECKPCLGTGRFGNHHRARGWDTCGFCHGIGWLPAPGDALTAEQAQILALAGVRVEWIPCYQKEIGWIALLNVVASSGLCSECKFRFALAQEEAAAMESVEWRLKNCHDLSMSLRNEVVAEIISLRARVEDLRRDSEMARGHYHYVITTQRDEIKALCDSSIVIVAERDAARADLVKRNADLIWQEEQVNSLRTELAEAVTLMRMTCADVDRISCDQADVERITAFLERHPKWVFCPIPKRFLDMKQDPGTIALHGERRRRLA